MSITPFDLEEALIEEMALQIAQEADARFLQQMLKTIIIVKNTNKNIYEQLESTLNETKK